MNRSILLAALLPLAGCLDFDEQEIRVAYDAEHDRIDAQLVYRGLYSATKESLELFRFSPEPEDREGTESQLDQLLGGRPLFALGSDFTTIDLVEERESEKAPVAELAKLASADRGDFFKGEDGRIGAWQHLRVRKMTRVLEIWDAMWREKLANSSYVKLWQTTLGCDDAESIELWSEAIAKSRPWFERSGAELLWRVPAGEKAARALAARIASAPTIDELLEAAARKEAQDDDSPVPAAERLATKDGVVARRDADVQLSEAVWLAAALHAFGVTVRVREGGADFVLWDAARTPQSVHLKPPASKGKHYDLAPYLTKRKIIPRTDVTEGTLAQSFAEFRAH